jgi:hypothetical protein
MWSISSHDSAVNDSVEETGAGKGMTESFCDRTILGAGMNKPENLARQRRNQKSYPQMNADYRRWEIRSFLICVYLRKSAD